MHKVVIGFLGTDCSTMTPDLLHGLVRERTCNNSFSTPSIVCVYDARLTYTQTGSCNIVFMACFSMAGCIVGRYQNAFRIEHYRPWNQQNQTNESRNVSFTAESVGSVPTEHKSMVCYLASTYRSELNPAEYRKFTCLHGCFCHFVFV